MSAHRMGGYVVAAVLVRSMDAGATVGMVLLCTASGVRSPVRTAALVGGALTAPHALGFLSAPLIDRLPDPRRLVAAAAAVFAVLLLVATLSLGAAPLWIVLLSAIVAGFAGPFLTGGLSSLLEGSEPDARERRLRALDALTYGLAGALAPAAVALLARVSPRAGLVALTGCGVLGAVLVLRVPAPRHPAQATTPDTPTQVSAPRGAGAGRESRGGSLGTYDGVAALVRNRRLCRVALLTWWGALLVAATLLTGMALGEQHAPGAGGWVAAAFGAGGLVGGYLLTVRPTRADPDRGMVLLVALLAPLLVAVALGGGWFPGVIAAFAVLGALVAAQTVLSLAARSEYSPPEVRGSVFVTIAGTKVAFSSAGTALAGVTAGAGYRLTLFLMAGAALVGALVLGGFPRSSPPDRPARQRERHPAELPSESESASAG